MLSTTNHAGKVMADLLVEYGVTAVFGLPGGQTLPLYYGILDNAPKIKHILMRDENNAAFAADAYARISRKVGVCDATAGCGGIKFAPAMAEALNSSSPVLAVAAEMDHKNLTTRYRGGGAQLADVPAVMKPVTKWVGTLHESNSMAELVQTAVRMAVTGRPGPVFIDCPWELFMGEYTGPAYKGDKRLASVPPHRSTVPADLAEEAIAMLKSAKKPVILAGGGAWMSDVKEELTKFAELLAIPVATSLSGKGVLDETNDLSLGVVGGLGGNDLSKEYVMTADAIFAIGFKFSGNASFNFKLPLPEQKVIQLDIDGVELGKMSDVDIALNGDVKATLAQMLDMLAGTEKKAVPADIIANKKAWLEKRAASIRNEKPIMPQQVVSILSEICDENTILACDASFSCGWAGTYFDTYGERRVLTPRGMSGLGYGLPAGVGCAAARPDATVVVLTGDGGFNYCLGELQTLHEQGMNVKVVVLNNKTLGWIKWYESALWEGRFTEVDTMRNDYAMIARGSGIDGYNLSDPETLKEDLKKIFAKPGPALVDIITTETEACKFTDNELAVEHVLKDHVNKL